MWTEVPLTLIIFKLHNCNLTLLAIILSMVRGSESSVFHKTKNENAVPLHKRNGIDI